MFVTMSYFSRVLLFSPYKENNDAASTYLFIQKPNVYSVSFYISLFLYQYGIHDPLSILILCGGVAFPYQMLKDHYDLSLWFIVSTLSLLLPPPPLRLTLHLLPLYPPLPLRPPPSSLPSPSISYPAASLCPTKSIPACSCHCLGTRDTGLRSASRQSLRIGIVVIYFVTALWNLEM